MSRQGKLVLLPLIKLPTFPSLHVNLVFLDHVSRNIFLGALSGISPLQLMNKCFLPNADACIISAPSPTKFIGQLHISASLPRKDNQNLDLGTHQSNLAQFRSPTPSISFESFSLLSWTSAPLEFYLCSFRKWHHFTDTVIGRWQWRRAIPFQIICSLNY